MPTAHKLPSGSWRCQVTVAGRRMSVTGATKKETEFKASELQMGQKRQLASGLTVGQAVRVYIDSRDAVRSPSTIQGYEKIFEHNIVPIRDLPIRKLDRQAMQEFINGLRKTRSRRGTLLSSKSIYNIVSLVVSAIRYQDPHAELVYDLPDPQKHVTCLLDPRQVNDLITGTSIELPCLLAMWLSLTLSEIRGLTPSSVVDGMLLVKGAVIDVDGQPVHKESNKEYSRTRILPLPSRIRALIEQTDAWRAGTGYLVPLSGQSIYKRWIRMQEAAGLKPPMTFHALRHLNASIMLALNIPDTYAMERGGWSSPDTLKRVYQHTLTSRRNAYDRKIDRYFEKLNKDR